MRNIENRLRVGLLYLGVALLGVLGLAMFAVLAVAVRPLLIVAGVAALVGVPLLSHVSPGLRRWFDSVCQPQ